MKKKKIHAVIVTYNPDVDFLLLNVNNLLCCDSVNKIHIVDNTVGGSDLSVFNNSSVKLHVLGENRGIATAQNVGMRAAIDEDADYIILFDQDSTLLPGLISGLLIQMEHAKKIGLKIACIGPRPLDVFSRKIHKPLFQKEDVLCDGITICKQIIASGKLIDTTVLSNIGLMDDGLFIDGVDHEWCWRARNNGYIVAISDNIIMEHKLGDARGVFLGLKYKIGAPIRMYYQFRNILILIRRGYVPMYWKVRNLIGVLFRLVIFGLFDKDRGLRREYMFRGILDGFKNISGPYIKR
ncbi:glycosyltransferase family 2 protein [Aeromonas veronii]|uniref:glycosyltransferase family 2 protein n=1 Tax=Aeromonas veronii TaxID=654 RepID=UPI003D23F8CC